MTDRYLAVLTTNTIPDGFVFVYRRTTSPIAPWVLEQKIVVECAFPGMLSSSRIVLDEHTLVVGAFQDDTLGAGAGAAYVYQRTDAGADPWRLVQTIYAPDGKRGDAFGLGLSLQGSQLVIGAPMESSVGAWNGAAYCFEKEKDTPEEWVFREKLLPRSLGPGDSFGAVVDVDGDILAVAAPNSSQAALQGGAVYLFRAEGGSWVETQVLAPPDIKFQDGFGAGVAVSGDWMTVGSPGDDELGNGAGAVHLFRRNKGYWAYHQKVLPETGVELDGFGGFIVSDGSAFYVGDPFVDEAGIAAGTVYGFSLDVAADTWIQDFRYFPPDLDANDNLAAVAARNGIVAAGATKSGELGAVYVFSGRAGRDVASYCTPTSGSLPDCAPTLDTLGAPSASQGSTFRIWSRHVPGAKSGVLLYSPGGPARTDLAASGVCIPGSGLRRKGLFWSGGTFGACDGSFHLDWNDFIDDRDPADSLLTTPGATVHVQVAWFDALVPGAPAWSDALAFQLCP